MAIIKFTPEEFDPNEITPLDPTTGVIRGIGDVALNLGKGAANITKAYADSVGANNTISKFAQTAADFLDKGISQGAKDQEAINQFRSQAAEGKGAWEEVKAAGANFFDSPLDSTANAVGDIIPTIAIAKAGKKARLNPMKTATGAGLVMGAGVGKGAIYDEVERAHLDAGKSPEEAARLATEAQSYGGQNADMIALSSFLGGATNSVGAEKLILSGLGKKIAERAAKDVATKIAKDTAIETIPEAIQGGQEKFAGNLAVQREGFDRDLMAGVYDAATIEGLAGAGVGAGVSAVDSYLSPREKLKKTLEETQGGAITDAAIKATETGATDATGATLALPHYAGEPLVTFPDGSTMTGAEAEQRKFDERTGATNASQQNVTSDVAAGSGGSPDNQPAGGAAAGILEPDAGIGAVARQPGTGDQQNNVAGIPDGQQYSPVTAVDTAAHDAATSPVNNLPEPTQAQKEAGNYKVGRVNISGLNVSIENPHGSTRSGKDKDGKAWQRQMNGHYGYVKGVKARAPDKEHVDVNVKAGTADTFDGDVFIVNQIDPATGKFDEPKAMIGYASQEEAEAAYRSNYDENWQGMGGIVQVPMAKFKEMLNDEKAFLKPVQSDAAVPESNQNQETNTADIRPIVESIAKRRAAAQQMNKGKAFDTALDLAKRMLAGEQVKPGQLQMAARQLKNDAELFDQVSKLVEIAKAPAKAARAERTKSADGYRSRIGQAKTEAELQAIAGEIAKDTKLTDTQAADLDDAVMEAMDALDDSTSNEAEEKLAEQIADEVVAEVDADPSALEPKAGDSENEAYLKEQVNERIEQEDGKQAVADAEGQAEADTADGGKESGEEVETGEVNVDADLSRVDAGQILVNVKDGYRIQKVGDKYHYSAAGKAEFKTEKLTRDELVGKLAGKKKAQEAEQPQPTDVKTPEQAQSVNATSDGQPEGWQDAVSEAESTWEKYDRGQRAYLAEKAGYGQARFGKSGITASMMSWDELPTNVKRAISMVFFKNKQVDIGQKPSEVDKAKEALQSAGVKGKEYLDTVKDVRQGNLTAEEVAEAHGQKIEDFGEKMAGARKDMEAAARKEWSDEDLATQPLSKIWPVGDIDAIEDPYIAAWAFASRAEIPPKPRTAYKVARWVASVKSLRLINQMALDGILSKDVIQEKQKQFPALAKFEAKVRLLEKLPRDQWKRIGNVAEWPNAYTYGADRSTKIPTPQVHVQIDGANKNLRGSSVEEVLDDVNEALGQAVAEKRMEFQVRGSGSKFHIYKKGDSQYHKLAGPFEQPADAFTHIKESYDDLVAAWDGVKERENVKKTDVRGKGNKARTGEDWRKGKNVTPEEFAEQFGFRGIEFGNWVNQGQGNKDRQGMLNQAYDGLMDLASIIGIPPKAISLNGSLGLAFGSRGKGWAAAHFEPGNLVINLTKTKGAGSLAHEWFHALDNYFSRMRGGEVPIERGLNAQEAYRRQNFITYRPEPLYVHKTQPSKGMTAGNLRRYRELSKGSNYYAEENWQKDPKHPNGVRPEVESAFADVVEALDASPMNARAKNADKGKEGYWSQIIERAARSFENYVIHKMRLNGYDNEFLANVTSPENFPRNAEMYPYLLETEIQPVADAFDTLFSTIQTKETDTGVMMFSRSGVTSLKDRIAAVITNQDGAKGKPLTISETSTAPIRMLGFDDLPVVIRTGNDGIMKMHFEHGLSAEGIADALEQGLNEPTMMLQHKGQADVESVWMVTDKKHNGMPIVLAIQPDQVSRAGDSQHLVATALAIEPKVIASKIKNGDLLYRDTRANQPDVVKLAVQSAQKKYAQEPRMLLGAIPNRAPVRGRAYKVLSQSDLVKNQSAFSRQFSGSGMAVADVERTVNRIRAGWKNAPEIIVVDNMNDSRIRKAVRDENERQLSQGAQGQPEGFYDARKVYIVASELNSEKDVVRVLFHETLGHAGLRGLYGSELGKILDQVAMMRKKDIAAKAKQYGLDATNPADRRIAAEEVLAEMAQTNPQIGFVKRAIAAIRNFLRKHVPYFKNLELTDADIIQGYLLPARNYVIKGAKNEQGARGLVAAFNRDSSPTTAQLFKELTLNDDMFKYPKSNATGMKEVFNEVAPGLVHIEKSKSFDDDVSELYSVYPIDESGNPIRSKVGFINVYDDGKVEINVSSLGEGFGGSRIYAAVGNWAHNNGKVFSGDREGISPAGISRRLENMISLALKFGTTDHIAPHKDQMSDLEFDWKDGDFEYNLGQMLEASYRAIRNGVYVTTDSYGIKVTEKSKDAKGVSKLDDLVYDFDKHQFTDLSNGKPYTTDDFDDLAATAEARATYAGRTTLQRAALGNTFMGATGKRKQLLLEQLGKLRFQHLQLTDPQLAGIFYSRAVDQTQSQRSRAEQSAIDAANKELERQAEFDVQKEMDDIAMNGNGADISELAQDPRYWDAENEELTEAGYAESDRLNRKIAEERAGYKPLTGLSQLDNANQTAQAEAFNAYAEALGLDSRLSYSSGGSRYVEVGINGEYYKFRFADHFNTVRDTTMQPDFNVAPGRSEFTEAIDWLDEKVASASSSNFVGTSTGEMQERSAVRAVNAEASTGSQKELAQQNAAGDESNLPRLSRKVKQSSTGNQGTFDPTNPDIRFSRSAAFDSVSGAVSGILGARSKAPKIDGYISQYAEQNRRLREEHITLWDKAKTWLKRQLAPGGLLPESVFAEKISRDNEFQATEFDVSHLVGQLEKAIAADYNIRPDDMDEKVQSLLSDALSGNISQRVPESTRTALVAMRQYIDGLSGQYLEALKGEINMLVKTAEMSGDEQDMAKAISKAELYETIAGNIGEYVHRSYRAFDDADWPRKVPDNVIDDARNYLIVRFSESGEIDAERRAEVVLNEILKHGTAYENMEGFIKESKLGAKDLSVLKRRKEIAPEIRALLGEYKDPRINFAKSATKMSRMIFNQRFLESVLSQGMGNFLFTNENKPPEATSKISADKNEAMAPLNGLWVTPEVNQAFIDALGKEKMEDWYRKVVQINGMVKYGKTVLSPTTAARNWMSAYFFTVANGHFNMKHMRQSVAGLKEYFGHGSDKVQMAYLRKLKQLGVVYDTPNAGEMFRLLQDANLADSLTIGKRNLNIKKMFDTATKFYQYGDDFWKIVGFENEKRMWMETGMSEREAEVKAAERIRNTYPTYSLVGKGIQSLRRFPLAGTFVSFPAEIIRTSINMVRYLAEDYQNPATRSMAIRRGVGLAITSSFAYAAQAMTMAALGFDDEDDEAVRQMAAPWQRNSSFWYFGRDESGNLQFMDLSFLDPYNYWKRPIIAVLRGQPFEQAIKDVFAETLTPFFGTDITAGAIFEVAANKKDSGAPVFKPHDDAADQVVDIANHMRKALQPGIFNNMERTYKALAGETTISGRKYDPLDEAAAWVGFRTSTLDPKVALFYRSFDFKDAKAEAEKGLRDLIRTPGDVSESALVDARNDTIRLREQAYRKMINLVQAARRSGMSRAEIANVLRSSSISVVDAYSIMNGTIPQWRPSATTMKGQAEKARTTFGEEGARRVFERYRMLTAQE